MRILCELYPDTMIMLMKEGIETEYKKETKASVVKKKLLGLFFVPESLSQ